MIKSLVKKGEYFDSVSLMIVGKDVAQMNFVQDATVVMATQENKSILKTADLYLDEFEQYDDTDLLIVIKSDHEEFPLIPVGFNLFSWLVRSCVCCNFCSWRRFVWYEF